MKQNPANLIELFCQRVEAEGLAARLERDKQNNGYSLDAAAQKQGRRAYKEVYHTVGGRFFKVWEVVGTGQTGQTQTMIKYFVDRATGVVFDAKSTKSYNPNHEYGTLETLDEWDWSGYRAVNKAGKSSLVPKGERR